MMPAPRVCHAMVLLLVLAGWLAVGPARAEAVREWERLPDGRVVVEIYGRRFAFPPDMRSDLVRFGHGQRPHRTRPGSWEERTASLQEVIADRAAAERWWGGSDPNMPVGIEVSRPLVTPFLHGDEGVLDRDAMRLGPIVSVWVYQDRARTVCQPRDSITWPGDSRACDYFRARSRDVAAQNENGLIVTTPSFLRCTGNTYFVFPEDEQRTPSGDTAHISCIELGDFLNCQNNSARRRGYFITPGIFVRYEYFISRDHVFEMLRIDDAFRAFLARHFIEDDARGQR
jgi:hypothetical protein